MLYCNCNDNFKPITQYLLITAFDQNDAGEKYCEMIINEATSVPLIDLPDDAPLPSFYDSKLYKKYLCQFHDFVCYVRLQFNLFWINSVLFQGTRLLQRVQRIHIHHKRTGCDDLIRFGINFGHFGLHSAVIDPSDCIQEIRRDRSVCREFLQRLPWRSKLWVRSELPYLWNNPVNVLEIPSLFLQVL